MSVFTDRFWLELRAPGESPRLKGPFLNKTMAETLREFLAAWPQAFITVVVIDDQGPYFEDAPAQLVLVDGRSRSIAARHLKTSQAAHAAFATSANHGGSNE